MSYQYTYPADTSFIDAATVPGPIRDAAHRLHQQCQETGADLWDVVEVNPDGEVVASEAVPALNGNRR